MLQCSCSSSSGLLDPSIFFILVQPRCTNMNAPRCSIAAASISRASGVTHHLTPFYLKGRTRTCRAHPATHAFHRYNTGKYQSCCTLREQQRGMRLSAQYSCGVPLWSRHSQTSPCAVLLPANRLLTFLVWPATLERGSSAGFLEGRDVDSAANGACRLRRFGGQSVVPWELALFLVEEVRAYV